MKSKQQLAVLSGQISPTPQVQRASALEKAQLENAKIFLFGINCLVYYYIPHRVLSHCCLLSFQPCVTRNHYMHTLNWTRAFMGKQSTIPSCVEHYSLPWSKSSVAVWHLWPISCKRGQSQGIWRTSSSPFLPFWNSKTFSLAGGGKAAQLIWPVSNRVGTTKLVKLPGTANLSQMKAK